ncbi:MAG TPA: S-layer homology domain-containing protein [Casimicrobiaceae bacterium]|nr:S-layer homology domain-containing protein [Casimicrobiaceae bacterium]
MRLPAATLGVVAFAATLAFHSAHAAPCAGFTDVDSADPFCPSVDWVRNRGITQGCTSTLYCPDAPVTRLQMAAFLFRFGQTMAAMHWVDPADAFVGRAGPEYTLELVVAGTRILAPLEPVQPAGYTLKHDARFEFEGFNCTGRRYFASGVGNTGARSLAATTPAGPGLHYAYVSGTVFPQPYVASRGDLSTGTLACTNLVTPEYTTARHQAIGPYLLPAIAFPLYLR